VTINLGTMPSTENMKASLEPAIPFARLELTDTGLDMIVDPATA
jgi:hypothetical protein